MNNGRVTLDSSNSKEYTFADNTLQPLYKSNVISGITKTPLYNKYFSNNNIEHIQQNVIKEVAKCSNGSYTISKQDDNSLLIIMRSIYLQYVQNLNDINKEIITMNKFVIDYCVHNIISNIKHYLFYLNDISKLPEPLEHPKYMRPDGLKNYKDVIEE
jgi:hypothetical protein